MGEQQAAGIVNRLGVLRKDAPHAAARLEGRKSTRAGAADGARPVDTRGRLATSPAASRDCERLKKQSLKPTYKYLLILHTALMSF